MFRRWTFSSVLGFGLVSEVVVFVLVAEAIGFGDAVLLTLLASVLGVLRMRRLGATAFGAVRGLAGRERGREEAFLDGGLEALGAALLIVPGFLTDLLGLLLLAPSGRAWVRTRLGAAAAHPSRRSIPGSIDLGSEDWTRLDPRQG